ncbi:MAG: hypothetical protein ACTH1D_08790 [Mycobacteriaceae bacterium]|uniref:hypothetical protein n=1 Tax=Corynebacterium sp. TaxID=1720 RepID=UPI003F965041
MDRYWTSIIVFMFALSIFTILVDNFMTTYILALCTAVVTYAVLGRPTNTESDETQENQPQLTHPR